MEFTLNINNFIRSVAKEIDRVFPSFDNEHGYISKTRNPKAFYEERCLVLLPGIMLFMGEGSRVINETMNLDIVGKNSLVISYVAKGARYLPSNKSYQKHNKLYVSSVNKHIHENSIWCPGEALSVALAIDEGGIEKLAELMIINTETMNRLLNIAKEGTWHFEKYYTSMKTVHLVSLIAEKIKNKHRNILIYTSIMYELLDSVIADLVDGLALEQIVGKTQKIDIKECKEFIDGLGYRDTSLKEIADLFDCNPSTITRYFKEEYGVPISAYLRSRRLEKAREALYNQEMSVTDLTLALGYKDVGSFSRAFKSYFGYPPSETTKHKLEK